MLNHEEIISKQDGQLISPITCEAQPLFPLSPSAPLPPPIKGTNYSFPHFNMCFRFIQSGNKGCNKGSSCQYAHPKLCTASSTSKICDRRNCYYYHVAGTSRPLTVNSTRYNNESVPVYRQFNSKPIPLMQMDVPFLHNPILTLP